MEAPRAHLEEWMRAYYFATDCDIGSSGVQNWSMKEVRELVGLEWPELDALVFHDSETLGAPGLRRALAERYTGGDMTRVMVTHGSSEGNYLAMRTLLDPGDEVVVPTPRYPQLATVAEMVGCTIVPWALEMEEGFAPSLEVARRVIGPKTKMVVVNFPHNPTGVTITRSQQAELIALCANVGAYLIWDGAFAPLVYDAPPLSDPTLAYDRAVSLGTLSKAFGLPGMRVGWCIAAHDVLARMVRLRDHTTLHLSPFIELIAQRVIQQAERLVAPRLEQARRNRAIVAEWVMANSDHVAWTIPAGGVCAAVRFTSVRDVDAMCHRLARQHRTLVVPGSCFGDPRWIRLGFGGPTDELREGLRRVAAALDEERCGTIV